MAYLRGKCTIRRADGLFLSIISVILALQWYQTGTNASVFFGSDPLYFGTLFPVVLWMFFAVLRELDHGTFEIIRKWLVMSLFLVSGYALLQFLQYDPIGSYTATFALDRVFSTLGNPNMLAGYGLLLLPFIAREKLVWMLSLSLLVLFNIFASGSISIALIAFVYVLWYFFRESPFNRFYYFLLLIIAGLSILEVIGISGILNSKLLSLATRGALIIQAGTLFVYHPSALFFGFPSDALIDLLDTERIALVKLYISDDLIIGNFHSLPVDILTRFGVIFAAFLTYACAIFFQKNKSPLALEVFILFVLFSLLHMPEVTHFAIFTLALAHYKTAR